MRTQHRSERGLSLVDLMLSIAISGVVLAALSAAIMALLSQQTIIQKRLSEARAPQFANQYFTDDINAARFVSSKPTVASCSPAKSETASYYLLNIRFQTFDGSRGVTTKMITYAVVSGTTSDQISRYVCSSSSIAAWDSTTTQQVAEQLTLQNGASYVVGRNLKSNTPDATLPCSEPGSVCLDFTTSEGKAYRLYGNMRWSAR